MLTLEQTSSDSLCSFKKFLFSLALYVAGYIETENFEGYSKIIEMINPILLRPYKNLELSLAYDKHKDEYSFTELKKMMDHDYPSFSKLLHS